MDKERIEEIIRVDHAGEHGATAIYKGTLDILSIYGDKDISPDLYVSGNFNLKNLGIHINEISVMF